MGRKVLIPKPHEHNFFFKRWSTRGRQRKQNAKRKLKSESEIVEANMPKIIFFPKVWFEILKTESEIMEDLIPKFWFKILKSESEIMMNYRVSQKKVLVEKNHNQNSALWGPILPYTWLDLTKF